MGHGKISLRVNDQVEVITGKDRGRVGKILKIDKNAQRITVERINMIKRHMKPIDAQRPGQIVEKEAPLHISNVMLICPECTKTVRTGRKRLDDGSSVRVCKACGATVPKQK